jgi:hypothetical protein
MPYFISDPITPSTQNIDLSEAFTSEVPQFVGFTYWVSTPGGLTAVATSIDLQWTDLAGQIRIINGSPIALQDGTAGFISPVGLMTRESNISAVDLVMTQIGPVDGAQVRYAILLSPGTAEQVGLLVGL